METLETDRNGLWLTLAEALRSRRPDVLGDRYFRDEDLTVAWVQWKLDRQAIMLACLGNDIGAKYLFEKATEKA